MEIRVKWVDLPASYMVPYGARLKLESGKD